MVGRLVTLDNFNDALAVITFFQAEGKPLVAAMLDDNMNRIQHLVGCEMKDRKILTSKYKYVT